LEINLKVQDRGHGHKCIYAKFNYDRLRINRDFGIFVRKYELKTTTTTTLIAPGRSSGYKNAGNSLQLNSTQLYVICHAET